MKFFTVLLLLFLLSCKGKNLSTESGLWDGNVFKQLQLPSANNYRTASGAPGIDYWQQTVDHDIRVELDVDTNTIIGEELITYHNNSPDELTYIWLQLEQNVHRSDSVRSREGRSTGELNHSGLVIDILKVNSEEVSWQDYGTLAKINLKKPLKPKTRLSIFVKWSFAMPIESGMRMGYEDKHKSGPIWELAQWFPVPCVYDDVYGWNTLPYIGRGEFYTNFGDYKVEITVPDNHIVFASGVLQNTSDCITAEQIKLLNKAKLTDETITIRSSNEINELSEESKTWKFTGSNIRTFAWATSASFIWDASSVSVTQKDGAVTRVLCQTGYPEEAIKVWDEGVRYLQHAVKYYSDNLYPYPWEQMSMVRGKAGGMEYPMLIFCRGKTHEGLFNVTDHEVGHNWFPMLVNTDERRHAWMDEGFNTFVNHYSLEEFYGEKEHKPDVPAYDASKFSGDLKPINTPADLMPSRRHLSYRKPGYGLRLLREKILGEDRFDFAFKEYINRWAFKSPRPSDFYRTIEDASGMDLQWFFRGFFEEPRQLDQAIVDVQQLDGKATITFTNNKDWVCPVDVTLTCLDGSTHNYQLPVTVWAWSTLHKQTFKVPSKVMRVEIDANEAYPDIDYSNNVWIGR